ncbi:hypothetical protein Taro_011806 [Colocasia esculenta]|uniref:MATH domain-containing protein n=1 Tax=Colocasia esculenta TaxID=4460 RepID=A0A843U794_COLES|nr:hypothetical protein [Colocasia esculenta]
MGGDEFDGETKGELPFLHTWKLERLSSPSSLSLGKNCRCSHAFHAGGYNWRVKLVPSCSETGFVSWRNKVRGWGWETLLFLTLVDVTSLPPYSAIEVTAELSILDGNVSYFGGKKVDFRINVYVRLVMKYLPFCNILGVKI